MVRHGAVLLDFRTREVANRRILAPARRAAKARGGKTVATLVACAAAAACGWDENGSAGPRDGAPDEAPAPRGSSARERLAESSILLVTLDTTRRDALGFAAADRTRAARTPVLDGLAADALEFTRAWTVAPLTLPAHASLFTGLAPAGHGVRENLGFRVPAQLETLAERLRARGFSTAASVGARVVGEGCGLEQGFEAYEAPRRELGVEELAADEVTRAAISLLARLGMSERPWFLWAHYFDPHAPYGDRASYLAEIERVDAQLGALFSAARARAGGRELLILVTADHGEALGDHGEATHGHLLHEATVRVPLLASHPAVAPGRSARPVSLIDVTPTLLEILGLDGAEAMDGRSFLGDLIDREARAGPFARTLCFESRLPWHEFGWPWLDGACDGRFKWVDRPAPALFDLAEDPAEAHDVSARHPEEAAALAEAARAAGEGRAARSPDAPPTLAPGEALLALGYVASRREAPPVKASIEEPPDRFELVALRDRGLEALARGEFDDALRDFTELRDRNGDPAPGVLLIAVACSRRAESLPDGDARDSALSTAESAWRAAVASCPDDALRRFNLAMTLLDRGRTEEAAAELERCLELAPDDESALRQLAILRAAGSGGGPRRDP